MATTKRLWALATIGLSAMLIAGCMGDQTRVATVEFVNERDEAVLVLSVPDRLTLADELGSRSSNWEPLPAGQSQKLGWTNSENTDLSDVPLCDELQSWYIMTLEPSATEGEILTPSDVDVIDVIENPCWDAEDVRYVIE